MPKTLLSLMEEAKKHTIAEALYFMGDTSSSKEEARRVTYGGPSRLTQGRSERLCLDKGKKNMSTSILPL